MNKKSFINIFLLIFIFQFISIIVFQNNLLAEDEPSNQNSGIDVNIIGDFGLGYANNPGLNKFNSEYGYYVFENLNSYLISQGYPGDFSGSNKDANFMYDLNGELRLFYSFFGFGIGTGYYATTSEYKGDSNYWSDEIKVKSELTAVPILATAYYRILLGDVNQDYNYSFFLLGAGVGYYYGKIKLTVDLDSAGEDSVTFKGNAIGYHLKLEYNWVFAKIFDVFLGIKGRYVEIKEFKNGDITLLQSDGSNVKAGFTGADIYFGIGVMI